MRWPGQHTPLCVANQIKSNVVLGGREAGGQGGGQGGRASNRAMGCVGLRGAAWGCVGRLRESGGQQGWSAHARARLEACAGAYNPEGAAIRPPDRSKRRQRLSRRSRVRARRPRDRQPLPLSRPVPPRPREPQATGSHRAHWHAHRPSPTPIAHAHRFWPAEGRSVEGSRAPREAPGWAPGERDGRGGGEISANPNPAVRLAGHRAARRWHTRCTPAGEWNPCRRPAVFFYVIRRAPWLTPCSHRALWVCPGTWQQEERTGGP